MMSTAKPIYLQVSRALLCAGTIAAVANDFAFWWIIAIPWAIVCLFGILITVPVFVLIGIGVGAAQADWMSDEFVYLVFFILPTFLAMVLPAAIRYLRRTTNSRNL